MPIRFKVDGLPTQRRTPGIQFRRVIFHSVTALCFCPRALKKIVASDCLTVLPVLNLDPGRCFRRVLGAYLLRNNALHVPLADRTDPGALRAFKTSRHRPAKATYPGRGLFRCSGRSPLLSCDAVAHNQAYIGTSLRGSRLAMSGKPNEPDGRLDEGNKCAGESPRPSCPSCGWHNTRLSLTRTFVDSILRMFSVRAYRCRSCRRRFWARSRGDSES